jgi:hypothetical protein
MKQQSKSHALIDGIIQEYDLCVSSRSSTYTVNEEYDYIGVGIIVDVCGIQHYEKSLKCFYRKKIKNKKRSSW